MSGARAIPVAALAACFVAIACFSVRQSPLIAEDPVASRVDEYVLAQMAERRIPGLALAVVRDGIPVLVKGYGVADVENGVPVTPETVFDIASVTKTFTAAAIMRLVDGGRVDLDRPVRDYVTDAPESWSGLTVRHLLTHTAGLPETDVPTVNGAWLGDYTTRQMLDHAFGIPLSSAPGARFQYSDLGYFLLGVVIERVSGMSYGEFLRTVFFRPLGMDDSRLLDQYAIVPRKAGTYFLREKRLARNRRYAQVELPSAYGLLTSLRDFVRWESALERGEVVSRAAIDAMGTPARAGDGSQLAYGLGWAVSELHGVRATGHAGGTGTYYLRLPERRLSVIVLTNLALRTLDGGQIRPNGSNPKEIAETVAGMYLRGPLSFEGACGDLVFDSDRTGAPDLYTVAAGGGQPRLLTGRRDSGDYSRVADWSPDRTRLAFQGKRGSDEGLFLIACTGGNAIWLPNTAGGGAPAWSPDGMRIAFVRQARVFLLDLRDGSVSRLIGMPDSSFYPAWSPDGSQIAFVAKGELTWEIFALDVRAGTVRQLTRAADPGSPSQGPSWSPDGRRIAFDRKHGEEFDIHVMNADGTSPVRLTHAGGVSARPAWSPDGQSIAFHSTRDRPRTVLPGDRRYFEIYTMSADGTRAKRITRNESFEGHPDWW
jgi:CubicO group peptidase (beta-lactamase class C family)